ncbi:MAG: AbrB/MazE/SpoVT family DNA-binding domain-containing protein [Candidatus Sulfotelmatobacter sp.]|jgi:AbrB family looped-hinge helix DNA binding protein
MPESDPGNVLRDARIKIEADGGLVIPAAFRSALGIEAGDEIVLRWEGHELCITKKLRSERAKRSAQRRARR